MKGLVRALALGASALAIAGIMTAPAEAQRKVRWKMHAAFAKNVAVIGPPPHRVAEAIGKMSNGDFDIRVFEPVSQGAIDAAWGTSGANQGKNSAFAFLSTWPFGPAAPEFAAWLIHGGGNEIAEELYGRAGIKFVLCGMIPPETSGWFRSEITSLDQLRGLKMRFFGIGAKVMQKFGVSTQQLAAADIYPALELGTIDATEFSMPAIDRSLGFYQIAKYNYFPGWHQQSTSNELLINQGKWDALSDSHKTMIEVSCRAQLAEMIADGEASQFEAMIENEKNGVKNISWSSEILDAKRKAWEEVLQEELKANPDVARVWESYTSFHEKYKVWGEKGYLR